MSSLLFPAPRPGYKSKTLAAWIALVGGSLGLHRFYLYGWRDLVGWLHPLPTLAGLAGIARMNNLGLDDHWAWALIPVLGLMLSTTMLMAIIYGLMPDERWNARFNPQGPEHHAGWSTVFAVVLSLLLGATALMATLAFGGERFFEWQVEEARKISQ